MLVLLAASRSQQYRGFLTGHSFQQVRIDPDRLRPVTGTGAQNPKFKPVDTFHIDPTRLALAGMLERLRLPEELTVSSHLEYQRSLTICWDHIVEYRLSMVYETVENPSVFACIEMPFADSIPPTTISFSSHSGPIPSFPCLPNQPFSVWTSTS